MLYFCAVHFIFENTSCLTCQGHVLHSFERAPNARHDPRIYRHGRVLFQAVLRSALPAALLVPVRADVRVLLLPVPV